MGLTLPSLIFLILIFQLHCKTQFVKLKFRKGYMLELVCSTKIVTVLVFSKCKIVIKLTVQLTCNDFLGQRKYSIFSGGKVLFPLRLCLVFYYSLYSIYTIHTQCTLTASIFECGSKNFQCNKIICIFVILDGENIPLVESMSFAPLMRIRKSQVFNISQSNLIIIFIFKTSTYWAGSNFSHRHNQSSFSSLQG